MMGDELGRGRCAGRDPEGGRRRRAFPPLLSQQPPAVHIRLRESRQGPSSGRLPAAANSSAARNVWNLPRPRPPASGRTGSKHQARVSARSARRLRSPLSGSPPSVAPANLATWGSAAGVGVAGWRRHLTCPGQRGEAGSWKRRRRTGRSPLRRSPAQSETPGSCAPSGGNLAPAPFGARCPWR